MSNSNLVVSDRTKTSIDEAETLCRNALLKAGYSDGQADVITDHLVDAELRGNHFTGLARVLSIVEHLQTTGKEANMEAKITRSGPTFAHLDGNDGVGYLSVHTATQLAIEKAKRTGVSVVGVNNMWYTGNLSYYAEMAAREDVVTLIASNGSPLVAPHGGTDAKFCTNPFCIGFPTSKPEKPIIWDIGTSKITWAQVKHAERMGDSLPVNSAYDSAGRPTINPLDVLQGAMAGWGGYKGSGLGMMIQLLGIAAGSSQPVPMMTGFGFLIVAIDASILQPLEQVKANADKFADSIRSTKMVPGVEAARMPFDRSSECRSQSKARGWFEVEGRIIEQLRAISS